MKKVYVDFGKRSYDILVCSNEFDKLGKFIRPLMIGSDAIIVTNPLIKRLFVKRIERSFVSAGFSVRFEIVPDSEKAKSERYCIKLLNNISRFDGSRRRTNVLFFRTRWRRMRRPPLL